MLPLSLTVPLTIISFVGLVINVIVLLVVILCKQVSHKNEVKCRNVSRNLLTLSMGFKANA